MFRLTTRLHQRYYFIGVASPHRVHRRFQSQQSGRSNPPTPWRPDGDPDIPSVLIEDHFTRSTLFTFDFFRRIAKYSAVGLATLGVTFFAAFQSMQLWIENVGLAVDTDSEVKQWEWDLDAAKWSGGERGGTDPALGYFSRLGVYNAFMILNWEDLMVPSTFRPLHVASPISKTGKDFVDARLEFAVVFLGTVLKNAQEKVSSGKLRQQSMNELRARYAGILERMGVKDALSEARHQYGLLWADLPKRSVDTARTALKLGDLNIRLGDVKAARYWWLSALKLSLDDHAEPSADDPAVLLQSSHLPLPAAQRILASTLVSLSAHYASSGELKRAQAFQERALQWFKNGPSRSWLASKSPPQALHAMYLSHRSVLLSIHHAEVLYALREPSDTAVAHLTRAALSAESIAFALSGLQATHPDAPGSSIPHPPATESALLPVFANSPSMRFPAKGLLRDARRTAAEAWNLIGRLNEDSGKNDGMERALECFERALGWAGVASDRPGGVGEASQGTLEADWKMFWGNYVRARAAVRKKEKL